VRLAPALALALAGAGLVAAPALAQDLTDPPAEGSGERPRFSFEVASDERVRGLSWSEGKAAATLGARVPVAADFELGASATTLRDSARHGGADALLKLGAGWSREVGSGWRLGLGATGYAFAGASGYSYAEVEGTAAYSLGPATVRAALRSAPPLAAIGGSNLPVVLDADFGLPGTPVTLYGGVGHSSGAVSDLLQSARLRPGGDYWDWSLGGEWIAGPAALGVKYTDTTVSSVWSHAGARVTGYVRLDF
jgi:hypothetical protein